MRNSESANSQEERQSAERIETILAVHALLARNGEKGAADDEMFVDLAMMSGLGADIASKAAAKARAFQGLDSRQRAMWMAAWRERLRNRGLTKRLDPSVHPEQIAQILKDEPRAIRRIIESNLPDEIAEKVAIVLQSNSLYSFVKKAQKGSHDAINVDERLLSAVRLKFLSNFTAFEDLHAPTSYDRFKTRDLGNFIWQLGIREIAIVSRGIKKKEQLAGFLNQFNESAAKAIARAMADFSDIGLERVKQSENRLKELFRSTTDSDERVRGSGMAIFAEAMSVRPGRDCRFSLQKLPVEVANDLENLISRCRAEGGAAQGVAREVRLFSDYFAGVEK
ncbi:MAG: hypothetical protein R2684_10800 [Pyrinomonadaceae bacterium]